MSTTNTATDTEALVALLDVIDNYPGAAALRARSIELLAAPPGAVIVDVGCGAGRAVAELAEQGWDALGIDLDEQMITIAGRRWPRGRFEQADAASLPLADHSVHGYRAEKVFHDIADPTAALTEAHRVLAPGGRIVLIGQDWDGFFIDSDHPALTRTIVHARADTVAAPRAARRYRNLLLDTGFGDPRVEVHTGVFTDQTLLPMLTDIAHAAAAAGAITATQAEDWISDQTRRARRDRGFVAIPLFVAHADRRGQC
ncbi:SAM-dependent methyltransferase (plasmid) [Rhodococcus oxybenzonivorans]|uniref:SAM-dependent methyltransferase n=1 Tax=Rhodococcus oxybenzonivorans TaxID=1990687 RepID=A0A2S2C7D5_9NOCA|nr:methyltransferase domain-containing protein [Rhodococcus oxybenzonivorans]AWK76780.1 SAM-dependent methyltransferase [Rhodococcus oxybenzonivorans]